MSSNRWVSMVFIRAVCCLWFRTPKECHEHGANGQQVWERALLWFRSSQFLNEWTSSFFQVTLPAFQNYHRTAWCLLKTRGFLLITVHWLSLQTAANYVDQGLLLWCISSCWDSAHRGTERPHTHPALSVLGSCARGLLVEPACSFEQETLCNTTCLWAFTAPITDYWAWEQRGASGTMVLITRFIFFLPPLLILDVWVFLFLALFSFACF